VYIHVIIEVGREDSGPSVPGTRRPAQEAEMHWEILKHDDAMTYTVVARCQTLDDLPAAIRSIPTSINIDTLTISFTDGELSFDEHNRAYITHTDQ
jgi:hypothetical protein